MESPKSQPKILLVANVSKEHVLKFHVPTIKMLSDSGWHIDVACSGEEKVPYCNEQFKMSYKRSPFNLSLFKGIKELKKIIYDGNYNIVYCHTPVGGLVARLTSIKARKKGTKVIYMAHGHYFFKGGPLVFWLTFYPLEKVLSYFTDSIILINKEDYDLTKKKFLHKGKTYLLDGIGMDLERFKVEDREKIKKEYRKILDIPEKAIVLVYLAELLPNKNQKLLMNVLKNINKDNKNVYLVLAGVDHSNGEFIKYAEKIGIKERFRYLGWREDVSNIYAMADICVASSIREGFGLNLVEAMKSGLPVVATDNRGHRTIITDGENGFLVPLGDEKAFTEKVKILIENETLRKVFVEKSNENIYRYTSEMITKKIKVILEEHL